MNRPPVLLLSNVESTWTPQQAAEIQQEVDLLIEALRAQGHTVAPIEVRRDVAGRLVEFDPHAAVVFNWCEGLDGQPKAYDRAAHALELSGFAFTGSGSWTLAHTQNKGKFKAILDYAGVSTPRWLVFTSPQQAAEWTIFPAIVKPVGEHCSEGITLASVVTDQASLRRQIETMLDQYGVGALVEEFIGGREIYASIWGDGAPHVLPLHEVDFSTIANPLQRLVDYEAKWDEQSDRFKRMPEYCPTDVDTELAGRIRTEALAAYRALRCRDYGRIDLRIRDGAPYVVDVNPNCDVTATGGFALAARVAGFDYGQMLSQIVSWAAERMPA
ncbi:MAG TPA: ATP-grasp domain-containing protein [Anaerolineae bacterium]|nr:ATP-grasp domain-containing protein [Anaerolineae bacterium]